jgi:hypothetical protein
MYELTHPVELRDQELDLVAAGSGGHDGGNRCCPDGDKQIGLVNVSTGDINVLSNNNVAVLSAGFIQT